MGKNMERVGEWKRTMGQIAGRLTHIPIHLFTRFYHSTVTLFARFLG